MMRWLAAGLWGLSAVLITMIVLQQQSFGAGELGIAGASLALAVLIGVGGRPGLVGAMLGAGLAGLGAMLFIFSLAADSAWFFVATSATLTVVSGLAAREMWSLRVQST